MSAGSLTVHGSTRMPSLRFRHEARVTLRQYGDQVPQPAALTSRGTDPPWAARSRPACHGDGRPASRWTVSLFAFRS